MAASSPNAREPHSVTIPMPIHTARIAAVDGSTFAIVDALRNTPEPMIEPTTIIVESNSPSTRGNFRRAGESESGADVIEFPIRRRRWDFSPQGCQVEKLEEEEQVKTLINTNLR